MRLPIALFGTPLAIAMIALFAGGSTASGPYRLSPDRVNDAKEDCCEWFTWFDLTNVTFKDLANQPETNAAKAREALEEIEGYIADDAYRARYFLLRKMRDRLLFQDAALTSLSSVIARKDRSDVLLALDSHSRRPTGESAAEIMSAVRAIAEQGDKRPMTVIGQPLLRDNCRVVLPAATLREMIPTRIVERGRVLQAIRRRYVCGSYYTSAKCQVKLMPCVDGLLGQLFFAGRAATALKLRRPLLSWSFNGDYNVAATTQFALLGHEPRIFGTQVSLKPRRTRCGKQRCEAVCATNPVVLGTIREEIEMRVKSAFVSAIDRMAEFNTRVESVGLQLRQRATSSSERVMIRLRINELRQPLDEIPLADEMVTGEDFQVVIHQDAINSVLDSAHIREENTWDGAMRELSQHLSSLTGLTFASAIDKDAGALFDTLVRLCESRPIWVNIDDRGVNISFEASVERGAEWKRLAITIPISVEIKHNRLVPICGVIRVVNEDLNSSSVSVEAAVMRKKLKGYVEGMSWPIALVSSREGELRVVQAQTYERYIVMHLRWCRR